MAIRNINGEQDSGRVAPAQLFLTGNTLPSVRTVSPETWEILSRRVS